MKKLKIGDVVIAESSHGTGVYKYRVKQFIDGRIGLMRNSSAFSSDLSSMSDDIMYHMSFWKKRGGWKFFCEDGSEIQIKIEYKKRVIMD